MDILASPEIFIILFFTGLIAGFIDAIAGGGGLVTLPVLLAAGLPPQVALGTNKLQGSFGTLSASYNYIRKGEVELGKCLVGALFTFVGASTGSWAVQRISPVLVQYAIPWFLSIVLIYTFFSPRLGYENRKPKMNFNLFFFIFGLLLGFYDGFFGPGTGSFWTAALCIIMGMNMIQASGYTRIMNFISNIVALSMFIVGGNVFFKIGITMALGQIVGARYGSTLAIRRGARVIRPVFLSVVLLTICRLLYNNYF
jgi:uncharacterized membrane protein YfcA